MMRVSASATIAAVAIGLGLVVMSPRPTPQTEPKTTPPVAATEGAPMPVMSLEGAALSGSRRAPLALVVFSDFQCAFCKHFADTTFRELDRDYIAEGKVLFAFRHLPLARHAQALAAASAATCAGRQGRFWEMHDRLFANDKTLKTAPWQTFVADLGLNRAQFDSCLVREGPDTVRADLALAEALEISGTPSFLIGRIGPDGRVRVANRVAGALPAISFKKIIDPLLASPPAS